MENKNEQKKEKSNLEIALLVAWQAFYLIWMVYDWGHKRGLKKGLELGKVEATAKTAAKVAQSVPIVKP